jgi:hypothetical protein
MKDEIKQFLKENWKTAATIIGAGILLITTYIFNGCGSSWRISGNTVNVNNKCQNDSSSHHNDTINNEIREIPEKGMDKER